MKIQLIKLIAACTFFLCFVSCQKNVNAPSTPTPELPVNDNVTATASVRGVVVNENDQPVQGAAVSSGSNNTTTDASGVFHFNNISLSAANGYVKVNKTGYFMGSRTFITIAGRIINVRIKLLPKTNTGSFTGSSGGSVTLTGGGKLIVPGSAITDAAGVSYSGTVNVAMTWINPASADLPAMIPGDLRGVTTAGIERGLQTFGMLGVELTGNTGQVLKIASGKTAELTFPVPSSLQSIAPATIDLWYFDETTGRWKQEGTATKTGSNYVGQVSHFSFWNCDAPFPLVKLCMKMVNAANNLPLNNSAVRIKRTNLVNSFASGYTDSSGNLCGAVPKDEPLVLEVLDQCWNVVYSKNIGPFNETTDMGQISVTIPPNNSLTITGTIVNCSNAVVANGAAFISTGGGYSYSAQTNATGNFSFTILRCNASALNFSVTGVDYTTLQQGNTVSNAGTIGTVNAGTLQACGTTASEFVQATIDGVSLNYIVPADSLTAYSYPDSFNTVSTNVFAMRLNGSNPVGFSFKSNAATTGIYPLISCYIVAGGTTGTSQSIVTASPTITITEFGPAVSGFVAGNFAIQMNFAGTIRNVNVNFRVRRY